MTGTLAVVLVAFKIVFAVIVLVAALQVFSMDRSLRQIRHDLDKLLARDQEDAREPNRRS